MASQINHLIPFRIIPFRIIKYLPQWWSASILPFNLKIIEQTFYKCWLSLLALPKGKEEGWRAAILELWHSQPGLLSHKFLHRFAAYAHLPLCTHLIDVCMCHYWIRWRWWSIKSICTISNKCIISVISHGPTPELNPSYVMHSWTSSFCFLLRYRRPLFLKLVYQTAELHRQAASIKQQQQQLSSS